MSHYPPCLLPCAAARPCVTVNAAFAESQMDHACYKCAQLVEDGVPFCAHCGAPQIRVSIPDLSLGTTSSAAEAVTQGNPALPSSANVPLPYLPTSWVATLQPCALAALVSVLLIALGLNPFVAMLGAGVLAVTFSRRRNPEMAIKASTGARLGAITGLFCFAMSATVEAVVVVVFHKGPEVRNAMFQVIQQAATKSNDPQVAAALDYFKSPPGMSVFLLFALVSAFFAAIILGSIGGALAGAFLGRHNR
jgi:hypothetical protein